MRSQWIFGQEYIQRIIAKKRFYGLWHLPNHQIQLIIKAIDQQNYKFDIFNLGSEEPVTINELVKKIIAASGKNLEIIYDPKGPAIGTKISINVKKARDRFNWIPLINLDTGIRITLNWYQTNLKKEKQ